MAERLDSAGADAALKILAASGGLQDESGQQVDFFENDEAPLPLPVKGKSGPKGGRPSGARNRSTEEWVNYYLSQNRAPLTVLGVFAGADVADLFEQLQDLADKRARKKVHKDGTVEHVRVLVDPLAVAKFVRDSAAVAAKYVHKEQPKALEIASGSRGMIVLEDFGGPVEEAVTVDCVALENSQENQRGGFSARDKSHALEVSHEKNGNDGNPLAFEDV